LVGLNQKVERPRKRNWLFFDFYGKMSFGQTSSLEVFCFKCPDAAGDLTATPGSWGGESSVGKILETGSSSIEMPLGARST